VVFVLRYTVRSEVFSMKFVAATLGPRVRAVMGLASVLSLAACASGRPAGTATTPASPGAVSTAAGAGGSAARPAPTVPMATSSDGTKIAYEVTGSGPALMLVPGGGQTRATWKERGYVDRLSKAYTVITLDLRGTGDSDKPAKPGAYALELMLDDLLAVADAAKAPKFHVWGFGHGAAIARYLAARSDRVVSAVLAGTPMGPPVEGMVREAILGMRAKWMPVIEAQAAGTLDKSTLSPGDVVALEGGIVVSTLMLGALVDYPPLEPAEIKAPTLWLIGAADTSAMENVKAYEPKLKGTAVTLKLLDGLSYSDSFSRIEPALAAVEPFLKAQTGTTD
jgi:pimeloyl-ACP methyl ester carboxylesterase